MVQGNFGYLPTLYYFARYTPYYISKLWHIPIRDYLNKIPTHTKYNIELPTGIAMHTPIRSHAFSPSLAAGLRGSNIEYTF